MSFTILLFLGDASSFCNKHQPFAFAELPSSKKKDVQLEECVEAVVVKGVWNVLQDHLEAAPTITKHLTTLR